MVKLPAILCAVLLATMPALAADGALSLEANAAYLKANGAKADVRTLASGLQIHIVKTGFGTKPRPGDILGIAYSAKLIDGTVVDGTSPGLAASVRSSSVIAGLGEALQMMRQGDHWQLALPARLAFPIRLASGADIPPSQTLLIDVTLMSVSSGTAGMQTDDASPITVYASGRQSGAMFTIHP